jgi:hypothetical protein
MVQLAMDGIGRGDARWTKAETFMRDNFGNGPGATSNVKDYVYGLFSFTKAMLLHSPGGVLTPITLLQSTTAGVNPIDWYSADTANGDPTDGVAKTLVNRQAADGSWYGNNFASQQNPYETAWSIIMLRRTVFVACVTNLQGRGTPSGRAATRVDLTWTALGAATSYQMLRSTTNGGPYTNIGAPTTNNFFMDSGGALANGGTYYYVLQPLNAAGGPICQSNQATVTIPNAR